MSTGPLKQVWGNTRLSRARCFLHFFNGASAGFAVRPRDVWTFENENSANMPHAADAGEQYRINASRSSRSFGGLLSTKST